MSNSALSVVMERIKGATPDSQIAVFKSTKPDCLDAVFASTVTTQGMIQRKHPLLIGVFDKTMNLAAVESFLREHIARELISA